MFVICSWGDQEGDRLESEIRVGAIGRSPLHDRCGRRDQSIDLDARSIIIAASDIAKNPSALNALGFFD